MFLFDLLPLCAVKDFILSKVLYSFQWTWTLCCPTDISLAVSVWMISVSFPPRGTVHKSDQWHQFPNRLKTKACLTYKAFSNMPLVKVPISQRLVCALFSFLSELQSRHWYACLLYTKLPICLLDLLFPALLGFMEGDLSCMYRGNQAGVKQFHPYPRNFHFWNAEGRNGLFLVFFLFQGCIVVFCKRQEFRA